MTTGTTLARGLGLFSLGLGLAQVIGPRRFATAVGVRPKDDRVTATRLVGMRELAAAGGLLASAKPVPWPWVRVGGDLMDVGLLGRALVARDVKRDRVAMALVAVAGIAVVDVLAGMVLASESEPHGSAVTTPEGTRTVRRAATVQASRQQAYQAWRDFERLPRFMRHLEEVEVIDDRRSIWRARAPLGASVEWEAEITEDVPGEAIAWRSTGKAQVANSGRVRFVDAPGDRGTEIHVELEYVPPMGPVGAMVARLLGEEPAQQVADDLRRFKQIIETGRVAWSDATLEDRKLRQRPAQPPEEATRQPTRETAGQSTRQPAGQPAAA